MKLATIYQRNKGQKTSLVTNNNDFFLFYPEGSQFTLEKVSDLTKCASLGVAYHFKTVDEAENWLFTNYAEFDEY